MHRRQRNSAATLAALATCAFGAIAAIATDAAEAQDKQAAPAKDEPKAEAVQEELDNPARQLALQPAVRHRLLLVKGRIELAPAFETTINADYRHTVAGGLKGEWHPSDQLSFGLMGFFGTSFNTGLTKNILNSLGNDVLVNDPEPSKAEYEQHLNNIPVHGAAYVSWTPWYGKLVAFGKAFVNFDFYFQGGLSVALLANDCDPLVCSDQAPGVPNEALMEAMDLFPEDDPPLNDGVRVGLYMGGGIHVFLNNWIALDLTVRNYMFSDNPSGFDSDADNAVEDEDSRFLAHLFMGIGVSFFLPSRVERTF